ncbi:MAG: cysteine--tRNA ligase [Candidatus Cloacimonetes bacterium]|nr:cysteine--tRNA ligase [Candidatus Cloacimonadota bacterium]
MRIYNTLSKTKEEFVPVEPGQVKIYACGPTVYNYFHVGNARTFLFFDIVRTYLTYKGYQVKYIQNLTDIDDKLIQQSIDEDLPVNVIAEKYIEGFFTDIEALGLRKADDYPRATEYIIEMIELIRKLEKEGFAYNVNGDVYFSVASFNGYGKLSGKNLEELKAGARVEENPDKKHHADFTLWKSAKPGEPSWDSPWGKGRPGWHTECVVMSQKLLGDSIDIHCGAVDLIFPHHENEIAQAEAITGRQFVKYWMHGGFLNISGEKMSKSLQNFFLTRDILQKYDAEALRFFFLSKHYRSTIDFSEELIKEADRAVKSLYQALNEVDYSAFKNEKVTIPEEMEEFRQKFENAMEDDFNTAKAIAVIFELAKLTKINFLKTRDNYKASAFLLVELGSILGFFSNLDEKLATNLNDLSGKLIDLLLSCRTRLKQEKNWQLADLIRDDLNELGIQIKDTAEGTIWRLNR